MEPAFARELDELETGIAHRFADWPLEALRRSGSPGVYTVWRGADFLYVGISWKEGSKGLFGRLNSHASGRRSGDQFCIYVCDLFVVPTLTSTQQRSIESRQLLLDQLTRDFIRRELTFRAVHTAAGADARMIEHNIRRHGLRRSGLPTINPA